MKITTHNVNRFEVIEKDKGRLITRHGIKAELSFQDDNKTLKVFLENRYKKEDVCEWNVHHGDMHPQCKEAKEAKKTNITGRTREGKYCQFCSKEIVLIHTDRLFI